MNILQKTYKVNRNEMGYLYRKNKLESIFTAGYYNVKDFWDETEMVILSTLERTVTVSNQEVLTADSIALRFSFYVSYKIADGSLFLNTFNIIAGNSYYGMNDADQRIAQLTQLATRTKISEIMSVELNEKRNQFTNILDDQLKESALKFGVEICEAKVKDITFPKAIQDLFAKQLEAKIRSKTELENARTAVATARTLKNAAELMKENEYIKFIKYMETIMKVAENGKNTFVIGDIGKSII